MKHHYECDVIGDGKSPETAFRAAVADLAAEGVSHELVTEFPADPKKMPKRCVVRVPAEHHDRVLRLPRTAHLPNPAE